MSHYHAFIAHTYTHLINRQTNISNAKKSKNVMSIIVIAIAPPFEWTKI